MVVGTVAVILICCIALFLDRYRSAMVQSAQTSSAQAVSQVSNTVGSYLSDMDQAMRLVEQSVSESGESRDRLLAAFLKFRPDVVAVTSYSADGELLDCWSPDREPKENILQNLSFDLDMARATEALAALEDGAYADDTVIYSVASVGESGWRAVGVSYVDELVNRNVNDMIRLSLWLAVVVLAVAVLTSWLLSRLIGKPLRGLASAMESFESDADHFTYRPVGGTREVQELSDSFEHMVLRIQELMTTVREEEVNLRKTELKALQAQINPHFLYNTLDSIAWMCEQGRNADAVKMVHALARLFRISISRGHELIPIAKELEHAESYLQIQMYRYKNQFTYTFDVDPDCLGYYCNKITLQPIIENSINHGLDLMVEEGRIDVRVRFDGDDIVFSVQDNGVGMSPEQLEAIMQHGPTDRTGIGIKNVNDRLKIYFGRSYGLSITSEPDVGTCVEIRMPRIREGDYETK